MKWRYLGVPLLALALAGCTAHYRQSLALYRDNEPTPFAQRTLEWAKQASETEPSPALPALTDQPIAAVPPRKGERPWSQMYPLRAAAETTWTLAAEFFGVSSATLQSRLAPLSTAEGLAAALQNTMRWESLCMALLAHSPALQAAAEDLQATLRQYEQAEFLEGILNEYRTFTRYLDVKTGEPRQKQMTASFFPYPGTMALKGEMVREQVRLAGLEWQKALRDATVEIGLAFFEYQYLQRQANAQRDFISLLENLVSVVDSQYRSGTANQSELIQAQNELAGARNTLRDLAQLHRAQAARTNALLGRDADARLGPAAEADMHSLDGTNAGFTSAALASRQEIRILEARLASEQIAIRMGEVMNRPPASQGYSLFDRGMAEASVGESLPWQNMRPATRLFPGFAQTESYLAEARQRLEADRLRLVQAKADTRQMVQAALIDIEVASRGRKLIEEVVLEQNRSAYETAQAGYMAGQMDYAGLMQSLGKVIQARLDLNEAIENLNRARLKLIAAIGAASLP